MPGKPTEPFIVSTRVVGPHSDDGPDLRPAGTDLRNRVDLIKRHHRQAGWLAWDTWRLYGFSPDGRERSFEYRDGQVDEQRWAQVLSGLPERYDNVSLSSDPWGELNLGAPDITLHHTERRTVEAHFRTPTAGVEEAAEALLAWLHQTALVPGVETGFVHVDSIADPYSEIVSFDPRLSRNSMDVEVFGYYWAVVLTAGHLDRLGGADRVVCDAPCDVVQKLDRTSGAGFLCVLTASPLDLDQDRVLAWREFLLPVLRTGYPGLWENVGVAGTPLGRAVLIFENDPVVEGTRFMLQHGHQPRHPVLPTEWADEVEDPEAPTLWCYPGPDFDRDVHPGAVNAIINAWYVIGLHGQLWETPGTLRHATGATWDTDDDNVEALTWQVDTGTCDPSAAIRLLVVALSDLLATLDPNGDQTLIERIRIA